MMLIFFIIVVLIFFFFVILNLFFPQVFPWYRPHLILERVEKSEPPDVEPIVRKPLILEGLSEPDIDFKLSLEERIDKLESILHEKNKTLEKLQKELSAEKANRLEFEKVKEILTAQIQILKDKNKELKIKIGEKNA